MRFLVQRETLLKPMQMVSGVVERRQTLPILSNVLLEVSARGVALTATDLEVELVAHTPLDGTEGGKATLPARKFMDICRALPENAMIELKIEGDRAVLKSGRSRFVLATLPASEFPNVEEIRTTLSFSVAQNCLKQLIEQTQFAMAQQDVRYYLNGLLLELAPNELRAVATDGHRLAYAQLEAAIDVEENQQIIVPRKGVGELARLLDDVETPVKVQVGTNHIRVITENVVFTSKLIDGRFPDYHRVIPQAADKVVTSDRETIRQALVRTSILTNEKYRSIRLQLEPNTLRVLAHNPEQEEAEEEMAVEYDGTSLEIGFNATYILDALSAVTGENIELRLSDANSCCLIQAQGNPDCKYVVMPMRL